MHGGLIIKNLTGDWPAYPGHPLVSYKLRDMIERGDSVTLADELVALKHLPGEPLGIRLGPLTEPASTTSQSSAAI